MDLYPSRRRLSISKAIDKHTEEQIGVQEKRYRLFGAMRITEILAYFMVIFPVLLVIIVIFGQEWYDQRNGFAEASRIMQIKPEPNVTSTDDSTLQSDHDPKDSLLGGLLVSGFNKDSCMRTRPYTNAERLLKPKQIGDLDSEGCKYVWMEFSGLGNRVISIASAFLCAMLTDRVLVVKGGESSLIYYSVNPHFHGDMLKRKLIYVSSVSSLSHLYIHLAHDCNDHDKMFFCEEDQSTYYKAYLAKADERIGLQIRVFDEKKDVSPQVTKQIISCVQSQEVLPKLIKPGEEQKQPSQISKTMYWENPTVTRDVIGIHQPSQEGYQQTEKLMHNRKAWGRYVLIEFCNLKDLRREVLIY
ncbi:BnaC09g52500D [Brassica napus]|nr:BnaC09g52500D [Brassica napus]